MGPGVLTAVVDAGVQAEGDGAVSAMTISVVTLFPQMFDAVSHYGMPGRAVARGLLDIRLFNPRDYTHDRHRTVDDRPKAELGGARFARSTPWDSETANDENEGRNDFLDNRQF